jgi:signal transduction histidine kinase
MTIVWTTILGIGHFGDPSLPITDRVLRAQAGILVVALGAYVLAALFAQRRESATHLANANTMLERERDNKLLNAQAVMAAIAHQLKQPLAAIAVNGAAALRFLGKAPPDLEEVRDALNRMISDTRRTSEVFDSIRALFGHVAQGRNPVDMNDIVLNVINSLEGQLKEHGVVVHRELAPELPLIAGHRAQLREVIYNLANNALEAMRSTTSRSRVLHVSTQRREDSIAVAIQDSGPGIDSDRLAGIFSTFVTTKAHGTGLGLAICRMIVEQHGGKITASSDGQSGALFQFALPITAA